MALDLFEETIALVRAFDRASVDYALVGAIALAVHGTPRATSDIDLLVRPESLAAALASARECGFTVEALPMRFSASGIEVRRVTKIAGDETLTLDLLLVNPGIEPVWDSRNDVASDLGTLRVVSREGLIRMKALAGREQDLADIRRLEDLDG